MDLGFAFYSIFNFFHTNFITLGRDWLASKYVSGEKGT